MKKLTLLVTTLSIVALSVVSGQTAKQNNSLEQEIRKLDLAEADAELFTDLAALDKFWAEDFTVNSPGNQVVNGKKEVLALSAGSVTGELKKWHRVTITFDGPASSEGGSPNPFRDYRLNVTFTKGSRSLTVPGYYAADGNASESSATSGSKWRVHFAPDEAGVWTYTASFRSGNDVALSTDPVAGTPTSFDGATGNFTVVPTDKGGRDHRGKGLLQYVGQHHLRFAESGEYFLKGGADSPENFLAYVDFDQTPATHSYAPHANDWRSGDPTWKGDQGKNIIGALNYLSGKSMNSVYFLTMNVAGDGNDVWPWTSSSERFRFDASKLDQWEIVFSHMDKLGILLHVITQETENNHLLDGGALGIQRKLYYRELIARFGHHQALVWNLGEENTNSDAERKAFADYIRALDPYDHPIVVHTWIGDYDPVYAPLLGFENFEGPSLQTADESGTHAETVTWVQRSAQSGRRWFVCLDEIGPAYSGVAPDADDFWHHTVRKEGLWGNLMGGGAGCEWYFGYSYPHNDLNCEDWRSRDHMWDLTRFALEFFQNYLPFAEMAPSDSLVSSGWCLAKAGEVYAVYLPHGGSASLQIASGAYGVQWYNPRSGGGLQNGSVTSVTGPGFVALGNPPADPTSDWAILVKRSGGGGFHTLTASPPSVGPGGNVTVSWTAPPGSSSQDWIGLYRQGDPNTSYLWWDYTGGSTNGSRSVTMPTQAGTYGFHYLLDNGYTSAATSNPVTVTSGGSGQTVASFTLVNADSDQDIGELTNGTTINLAALPTPNLNVRANTSPATVGSVNFGLDADPSVRVENTAPYALAGDMSGNYNAWTPGLGSHSLTATPYSSSGAGGTSLSITFTVIDDPGQPAMTAVASGSERGALASPSSRPHCGGLVAEAAVLTLLLLLRGRSF